MKKKSKFLPIFFTTLALSIGVAISSGVIRNSYIADETRAENATITIVQGSFGTNITNSYDSGVEKTGVANDIDIAAKAVDMNRETYRQAKVVVEAQLQRHTAKWGFVFRYSGKAKQRPKYEPLP